MKKKTKIDNLIIETLREAKKPLTTTEIIDTLLTKKEICIDEIPLYLNILEKKGLITKKLNTKTKTYLWSLP